MLLIFLALIWVALLTPVAVRKIRDVRADRSIESFHVEHEVLSRQGYSVAPAHRLEEFVDPGVDRVPEAPRRPRLTLVHPDDTYRSLESRTSWEEWSEDYDFDDAPRVSVGHYARSAPRPLEPEESANRYARAYGARPVEPPEERYEVRWPRPMRVQRRRVSLSLVGSAIFITVIAYFSSASLVADVAYVAWLLVVAYAVLALYALSQGYLSSSLFAHRAPRYPVAMAYDDGSRAYDDLEDDALDGEYAAEYDDGWASAPAAAASYGSRRAFG